MYPLGSGSLRGGAAGSRAACEPFAAPAASSGIVGSVPGSGAGAASSGSVGEVSASAGGRPGPWPSCRIMDDEFRKLRKSAQTARLAPYLQWRELASSRAAGPVLSADPVSFGRSYHLEG